MLIFRILSLKTLERFKIPVNLKYKALMSVESLSSIVGRETISQFNERIKDALNDIVNRLLFDNNINFLFLNFIS